MQKPNHILFLTDFSENARHAFNYAVPLARDTGAIMDVLHIVVPEVEAADIPMMAGRATIRREEVARGVLDTFIKHGLDQYTDTQQMEVNPITRVGNVVGTITAEVEEHHYDLVILGNRGQQKSAAEKFLGTVSLRVMQRLHCPVLLIPLSASYGDIADVGFASDLSASDPYHLWTALQLLAPHQPVVRWMHVKTDESEEEVFDDFKKFYTDRAPSVQIHFHELTGKQTGEEIESFSEDLELDMLIMVKSHRNIFERLIQPSLTRQMANHLRIPLLVMD